MKRLRTVNGVKYIQYRNRSEFEDKVQEAMTEHRKTLITRLMNGLNDYIDYRFHQRIDEKKADKIKDSLLTLRNQAVPLEDCEPIVEELMKKDLKVLSSSEFYNEIDGRIEELLKI